MTTQSKMVSVRLPSALVDRADFVVRNTEGGIKNRSIALRMALEDWLPGYEFEIRKRLGTAAKKAG